MTLFHIGIFLAVSLLVGIFVAPRYRTSVFLIFSLLAIFWLQPTSAIRHFDFWLPFIGLLLTIIIWFIVQKSLDRNTWLTLGISALVIFGICLLRYIEPLCCITASRPPTIFHVIWVTLPLILVTGIIFRFYPANKYITLIFALIILSLFLILKTDRLVLIFSQFFRQWTGQDQNLASLMDLRWIGFSYLAFRLLHYIRDSQMGKIPSHKLIDFIDYALFFPSFTAGPIERFPTFLENLKKLEIRQSFRPHLSSEDFSRGSVRIILGIFKKFVLADLLAIISLNSQNAMQITSSGWGWILLYAYALRIYFDFSGYTDIAIGMAIFLGIPLPENFSAPYLKTNITAFWNSWHITLAQWFRAYLFNPLTRSLRSSKIQFPTWLIILFAQLCTMTLIGLWHGMTINFTVWGIWHALGLFFHNRWADWRKNHTFSWENNSITNKLLTFCSWFITFNYVVLGWIWFALPTPQMTWSFLNVLLGFTY